MEKILINTPMIKLNSLLKLMNVVQSGGEAKHLILDGKVKVNNQPCTVIRKQIFPNDVVTFNGIDYKIVEQ